MSKRMKLAFSIEEILGLKAASEERGEIKPYSTEYPSPTISSPGSDSYLEYSSDDGKDYFRFLSFLFLFSFSS